MFSKSVYCAATGMFRRTALGLVAVSALFAAPAYASPATCDPAYWNAMRAKAWMEAQREVAQNQNLIYKADSVLEYSCFDNFLRTLASNAISLFSENESIWGFNIPNISSTSMDTALNTLVASSLPNYINGAFNHSLLGGRSSLNPSLSGNITQGAGYSYTCATMGQVWTEARCMNFNQHSSIDDFFRLSHYNGWDPRSTLPPGYTCTADGRWSAQQDLATNANNDYKTQAVAASLNFFEAGNCSAAPAIPTGVTVTKSGSTFAEHVCVNPGCAHDGSGGCSLDP